MRIDDDQFVGRIMQSSLQEDTEHTARVKCVGMEKWQKDNIIIIIVKADAVVVDRRRLG